jgi:hypothetical protein
MATTAGAGELDRAVLRRGAAAGAAVGDGVNCLAARDIGAGLLYRASDGLVLAAAACVSFLL